MEEYKRSEKRGWPEKFGDAFDGVKVGMRGQSSFYVHFVFAAVVVAAAAVLQVSLVEWCLLVLCITIVFCAELINSALEKLARAITDRVDPHVAHALNIGSAAVMTAAVGASVVGAIIFTNRLAAII